MSENNSAIETQHPSPPSDGSEVLSSARAGNKKGVSRRDFLKLLGATLASWLLSGCLPDQPQSGLESTSSTSTAPSSIDSAEQSPPKEKFLQPEVVRNVEVYGLGEKTTSEDQVTRLYGFLDEEFAKENNIKIGNKVKQRKELLNPNERYLEVVVRQSAYDSFSRRQQETGVNFVEWIQMHVDAMNVCFENAKPPTDMKSVLRRIVIVDDNILGVSYDETRKSELGGAFDVKWFKKFLNKYPINTDMAWAIADDYRVDTTANTEQGFFWSVKNKDQKIIFGQPPGSADFARSYVFPERDKALKNRQGVWLDFGLTHEWSHYLWNLPDEYNQNVHDSAQRFKSFLFSTGYVGSFHEPRFSPYLSYFAKRNIELKRRDAYRESRWHDFTDRPDQINIKMQSNDAEVNGFEVRRVRLKDDFVGTGEKTFASDADHAGNGDQVSLGQGLFEGNSNCWLIHCTLNDKSSREVFLPAAAFGMSRGAGRIDNVNYNIEFSGYENPNKKTQIVELVDQSDIEDFLNTRNAQGDNYYAKMKADGTDTWLVWFLRD